MNLVKNNKGITLIALIVTIIVIIILSGISISVVVGDDGIIKRAQSSKELTIQRQEIELIEQAVIHAQEYNLKENSRNYNEPMNAEIIKKECEELNIDVSEVRTNDGIITVYVDNDARAYTIGADGKVDKVNPDEP